MKKKLLIELFIYAVLVIIGIILLFTYEPKEIDIIIPQDFIIDLERGERNASVHIE